MKISLALGKRQPLSRQTAWGCFTTNLAVPGSGSLAAGRRVGYPQIALTAVSFGLTTGFGLAFIVWCLAHWAQLYGPDRDVPAAFKQIWPVLRWALLGIALFGFTWFWALLTSLQIVRSANASGQSGAPPILT